MTLSIKSKEQKLELRFLLLINVLIFFWFFFISFSSDDFFPFSRMWMFAYVPDNACSSYVESNNTVFPTNTEMDLLEIQNISAEFQSDSDQACSIIKNQFPYLPAEFKIKTICNTINKDSHVIQKQFYDNHECT